MITLSLKSIRPLLATTCLLAFSHAEEVERSSSWAVTAGPVVRQGMNLSVSGRSYSQDGGHHGASAFFRAAPSSVLGNRGAVAPTVNSGVLPLTGFANRSFDDGFVNIGSTTGVGGSLAPNHTWFWGYDNASQVDSSANTLTFHTDLQSGMNSGTIVDTGIRSIRTLHPLQDDDFAQDRDFDGEGVEISASRPLNWNLPVQTALRIGINMIRGANQAFSGQTFREEVRTRYDRVTTTHNFTDTYQAQDEYIYSLLDPISNPITPRAPGDSGTFNGLPLPSPLIPNVPSSHTRTGEQQTRVSSSQTVTDYVSTSRFQAWNQIDLNAKTDAVQTYIGPEFFIDLEKLSFFIAPRASLNYLELDVTRTEGFYSNQGAATRELAYWRHHETDSRFALGLALAAGIQLDVNESWFVQAEYGRDWIFGDVSVTVGPNEVTFDADGYTGKLQVGRKL